MISPSTLTVQLRTPSQEPLSFVSVVVFVDSDTTSGCDESDGELVVTVVSVFVERLHPATEPMDAIETIKIKAIRTN